MFLFLSHRLTKLLLTLDSIHVEGREDVRRARREAIIFVNQFISQLDSKTVPPSNGPDMDQAREIDILAIKGTYKF